MSIEDEIDELLEEAAGKDETRRALEAVEDHEGEIGSENVDVIRRIVRHYGTALRYLRHHR